MSRYVNAAHRIQTAIGFLMNVGPRFAPTETKHLRVGIDLGKADQAGLVTLLMKKGLFTAEEYRDAIADAAEQEADRYEKELQRAMGSTKVTTA